MNLQLRIDVGVLACALEHIEFYRFCYQYQGRIPRLVLVGLQGHMVRVKKHTLVVARLLVLVHTPLLVSMVVLPRRGSQCNQVRQTSPKYGRTHLN